MIFYNKVINNIRKHRYKLFRMKINIFTCLKNTYKKGDFKNENNQ